MVDILVWLLWLLVYGLFGYAAVWLFLMILALFLAVPPKVAQILYIIVGLVVLIYAIETFPMVMPGFPLRRR